VSRCGVVRSDARKLRISYCNFLNSMGGEGLARVEERGRLGIPGSCHILDRMNAINDYLKKKKDYCRGANDGF